MSYKILYTANGPVYKKQKNRAKIGIILGCALLLSGLVVRVVWPEETSNTIRLLFPWTEEQVVEAYNRMNSNIRDGDHFIDAFSVFCKDVIDYAQPE